MNRSAINAEVEYRLRMQERDHAPAPHHHEVPAKETKQPGLLARALASLKAKPRLQWERPGRPSVEVE